MFPWRDGVDTRHQQQSSPALPAPAHLHSSSLTSLTNNKKPGRWCAAHVRIAWEIHLGRLQQQQQQKQHASGLDKDESRPTTSSGSDSRYCDRTNENGRCKGQDNESCGAVAVRQLQPSVVTSAYPPHLSSIPTEHSFAAQLEAIYKYDCLNPPVRAMDLGLYPPPVPPVTSSSSSVSTSVTGGLVGLNAAAASELARLGDRAAAAAASGLAPWSLSPFTATGVDSPTDRLSRLDRPATDDSNKNLSDYVNHPRKDSEYSRDAVRDVDAATHPSVNVSVRQSQDLSPSVKRQSPVLRPDSTVMSEERGAVPDTSEHERIQPTSSFSASDSGSALSQRPPVWNPFLAAVTATNNVPDGDSESDRRSRGSGTASLAKVSVGMKHSHPDDEALLSAKKRKTNSEVHDSNSCVELSDASLRFSGQSPSSSTLDAQVPPTHNGDRATTDVQDNGSGSVCAPDSSCDEQSSTPDIKRFERVVKDSVKSIVQKDLTVVGGVQETGSLLPLVTQ